MAFNLKQAAPKVVQGVLRREALGQGPKGIKGATKKMPVRLATTKNHKKAHQEERRQETGFAQRSQDVYHFLR
jgi:hypothetical protein